jgi:hypothetical protein
MENNNDDHLPEGDEDEPEPLQPGDVLASLADIEQAINELLRDKTRKRKLTGIAALILRTKPHLKRQYEPEDLLQDALTRLGIGKRSWPRSRVDFDGTVIGVMRSWADNLEKQRKRDDPGLVLESELSTASEDGEPLNLEAIAGHSQGPVEELLVREEDALGAAQLACVRANYGPDELPGRILDELRRTSFENHQQVMAAVGAEEAEYRNAWKSILRAATKLSPKE